MVKVAIIGAGFIGDVHANSYKEIDNADLVAIVDKEEEKGNKFAEKFDVNFYTSLDELIKSEDVDSIDICTPTFLHPGMVKKAASAKKHILCEKPLALSLEEADEMIKAVKTNKVKAMIGHVLRFWPEYVKIKELIDSGDLGEPIHAFCERLVITPYRKVGNWDKSEKFSGGAAIDLHIHDLDLLIWLFGRPEIVKAQGIFDPGNPKEGGFAHIFTTVQFKNGKSGFAEGGWDFKGAFPFTMALRILCEKGTIEWIFRAGKNIEERSHVVNVIIYKNDGSVETLEVEQRDAFLNELSYFIDCIAKDRPIERATFEDGRASLELALAAIKSAKEKSVVKL